MVAQFLARFVSHLAEQSIGAFHHCSSLIIDRLHVPIDNDCEYGQTETNLNREESSTNDPPPSYVDVFESPYYVRARYSDNRALVNLANIASHISAPAHAKNCLCKTCRDRRHTFPKQGTGRRYGYRGTPIRTRSAAVGLDALSSVPSTTTESQKFVARRGSSKSSVEAPLEPSRLRGGDFRSSQPPSNRFTVLEIEPTADEDDDQQQQQQQQQQRDESHDDDSDSETTSRNSCVQSSIDNPVAHPGPSSTSHLRAQINALLDNEPDSDLGDHKSHHNATPLPTTATPMAQPDFGSVCLPFPPADPPPFLHHHSGPAVQFDTPSSDTSPQTSGNNSRQIPWEEDDWAERSVLGARVLSWTRTRLLFRYTQGEDEVEHYVEMEMIREE